MIPYCKTFYLLFKKYRLRAEFATLCEFGKALADEGFIYEDSIFSRWQKGSRIPQNRNLLITMVKIFMEKVSIASLKETDVFLESTGHRYLTDSEVKSLL